MSEPASPYFREEHAALRAQIRRFVESEIKPQAAAWEEAGFVPRAVLRQMGALGFLGIRYPEEFGGSGLDTLATIVLAEELGRSSFGGVAVTVPDAGSDVAAIRTVARRDGDDYLLNGTKMFITNGIYADLIFVAARTDPSVKGTRGISIFAVERSAPGLAVGHALKKQGWRSSDTAELVFADCRVPAENR